MNQMLNQDEIDALLGPQAGSDDSYLDSGRNSGYDLANQERNIHNRMATLGLINERFARNIRVTLYNFLRKTPEVSIQGIKICKYEEYINSLFIPTSINVVKMHPLKGNALFIADSKLVFTVVENFFGGEGKVNFKVDIRDFTPTEIRVIRMLLDNFFNDLKEAWAPIINIQFEYKGMEVNPSLANLVNLSEMMIISKFRIELEGGGGDFHISLPYSMIEPLRELLSASVPTEKETSDDKWSHLIKERILDANVDLCCILAQKKLPLKDVMKFKKGEVLNIEIPEQITLKINNIPLFNSLFGTFEGKYAVKIVDKIKNSDKR